MIDGWFLGVGESDEDGGDTERSLVSAGCFLGALNLVAFRLTNHQVRYTRDPSAESLVNRLLDEAM